MKIQDGNRNDNIPLRNELASLLNSLYNDYKKGEPIASLKKYTDNTSLGYSWMRKIVRLGILQRVNEGSRKYLQYTWAKGDSYNIDNLVNSLLTSPTVKLTGTPTDKIQPMTGLNIDDILEITFILKRNGIDESLVKQITKEIQLYFQNK